MSILFIIFQLIISTAIVTLSLGQLSMFDDLLEPYLKTYGSKHSIRTIRSIQPNNFGNSTYEIWDSHVSSSFFPVSTTRYFSSDISVNAWNTNHVYGHYTQITNPLKTFSVYEAAINGCEKNATATVEHAAKIRHCLVAQNGGFFRTNTGVCIGNVVSNGLYLHNAKGIQNAHFGITENGMLLTGYFSQEDVSNLNFSQLIGGVIWLVRNGTSFVEESIKLEEASSEETGTLRRFVDVVSARTAIGHDRQGRVLFVQVDGQTDQRGTNLKAFAKFLIEQLHVVNAINLDGGGSATLVLNGSLTNYPSDHCADDPMWRCQRPISTIICAHEPLCDHPCGNGSCVMGRCECDKHWKGDACDVLQCGETNCSQHGLCFPAGCTCFPGWHGPECRSLCPPGWFGVNCSQKCVCAEGSLCDHVTGNCRCGLGFTGRTCDQKCPVGKFGRNCQFNCRCNESCLCDAESGACLDYNETDYDQPLYNVSHCLARNLEKKLSNVKKDHFSEQQLVYLACAALAISVALNIIVVCKFFVGRGTRHVQPTTSDNEKQSVQLDNDRLTTSLIFKPLNRKLFAPLRWSSKFHYTKLISEPEIPELEKLMEGR